METIIVTSMYCTKPCLSNIKLNFDLFKEVNYALKVIQLEEKENYNGNLIVFYDLSSELVSFNKFC
jgi:hypothetical protein